MNTLNKLLLASLLVSCSGLAFAANDAPISVNFGQTQMGVLKKSTAGVTAGTQSNESRNISVTDNGALYTVFGTNKSSYTVASTIGSTLSVNGVGTDNTNVLAVANSSQPILVVLPFFGSGLVNERIRMFDSRGSTSTQNCIYDRRVTSTDTATFTAQWTSHFVSSGFLVSKESDRMPGVSTGTVIWKWLETNKDITPVQP